MKIKLLKDVIMKGAPTVQILAGAEIEATVDVAREWMEKGYAVAAKEQIEKAVISPAETRAELSGKPKSSPKNNRK